MTIFNIDTNFKPLTKKLDTHCFGCSPTNEAGLQMTFRAGTDSVVSRLDVPGHLCGWQTIVHGGVVTTILDEIMSWSAIHLLKRLILTTSITVDFIKPVFAGQPITAQGKVLEKLNEREALMKGTIFNADGEICAESKGTFRLFTPEAARKFKIMGEDVLNDFEQFIQLNDG